MMIQPKLLVDKARSLASEVFVCGPGYNSGQFDIRELAKNHLTQNQNVSAIYGEEIEREYRYRKRGLDLQTLEARFAHDVDFTLLILESPGSIAELGTFTQLPGVRDRLVVLLSIKFFRAESYIARGPLSLLAKRNPQNVIYYDSQKKSDMLDRVSYPLTFYKYAHYVEGHDYLENTRISKFKRGKTPSYQEYIDPIRDKFNASITLIGILIGDKPNYSELLLLTGLGPSQLNASLHRLFQERRIEKAAAARYRSINGYRDEILEPFSTTAISTSRAKMLASA